MKHILAISLLMVSSYSYANEPQKISFSECLNVQKNRDQHLIWGGPFVGATRTNGMIYTLNCGPVSTIRWETPEEYLKRIKQNG